MNPQIKKIEELLKGYLESRERAAVHSSKAEAHPDEDTLASFVDGGLGDREIRPMIAHLVDCSFCRHKTADLFRLQAAFADVPVEMPSAQGTEPTRISEVLSGLFSKIFGTSDGAVFAHHEEEDEQDGEKKDDPEKE
ncbi:MAG TPA: hypothetical protein PKD24_00080 [Pyrinomonadaceae bacterium]|nr:hypothetical protein [Pyrinomonadaceae bacterium]HMP64449.1 hypothetical protein [Pyrinomonadaceae bacterium]